VGQRAHDVLDRPAGLSLMGAGWDRPAGAGRPIRRVGLVVICTFITT
jgi:hypothetical protein